MTSVTSDKIVPFGQDFVFDEMSVTLTFKEWVAFSLCLIDSSVDVCEYSESRLSSRSGCQFACLLNGIEHSSAPDSGDLREEPVLNEIPLRAVRWVMGNTDIDAKSPCQLYQASFELPAPGVVRSASVTKNEDGLCIRINLPKALFPLLSEYLLFLGGSQTEPLRICILGKPCNGKFYYFTENGDVLGMLGERTLPAPSLPADFSLIEVLALVKFMETPVDGVTGNVEDAANKAYAMSAVPFCYDGSELSCLPFVRVSEVLHLLVCYYICWIIRGLHNCLEFSYKGANFLADLRIQSVNNQ